MGGPLTCFVPRVYQPTPLPLYPIGRASDAGTHCACGNQRRAGKRLCRACERYFWGRVKALTVKTPATCLRYCRFRLPRELCDVIDAATVALGVRAERAGK